MRLRSTVRRRECSRQWMSTSLAHGTRGFRLCYWTNTVDVFLGMADNPHRLEPNYPDPEVVIMKSPAPPVVVECWCLTVETMIRVRLDKFTREAGRSFVRCFDSRKQRDEARVRSQTVVRRASTTGHKPLIVHRYCASDHCHGSFAFA